MFWIDVYIGPPEVFAHDAGKTFIARAFQQSSNSMTYVERYHMPLKLAYGIIRAEASLRSAAEVLQYAVKSLNESARPFGLVPSLLVYGALPRLGLSSDKPTPGVYERAVAVKKETEQMSRYFAKRQMLDALRNRNGPDVLGIHKAQLGCKVLVYRTKSKTWKGPFTLLKVECETRTVQCPDGRKPFRSAVLKEYRDKEEPLIGMNIQVYWPTDKKFYPGRITYFNSQMELHRLQFDDGDTSTCYSRRIFGISLSLEVPLTHASHSTLACSTPNPLNQKFTS